MKQKHLIWQLLAAVLLILAVSVAVCWDALVMYAAPQVPLRRALERAITSLENRYQESPLPILVEGYDSDGLNTARMELKGKDDGLTKGVLDVQTDLEENRIFFRGTLPEAAKLGSLSVYLDRDCMALTSETLLQGGYYGITYDTFRQDLQSIPLVRFLVSEKLISQWEDSLGDLRNELDWDLSLPELPKIPVEGIKSATVALWALRGHASVQPLDIDGQMQPCWKVDYRLREKTAGLIWEKLMNAPMPEGGRIQFAFYLFQDSLVRVELNIEAGPKKIEGILALGPDVRHDDIRLDARINGVSQHFSLTTQQGRESVQLNGQGISYSWNPASGDFTLFLSEPLPMKLTPAEDGFQIQSGRLWSLIRKNPVSDYDCIVTIKKETRFQPPEFKNLDQWSLDDLLIFLNGVWTLIQPKIG